ncbi:MAG: hypothetical protein IJ846_06095, partial [Alphaproteobacteria bacterium]|nr:hypothetical protein [Alphaproteobacteria bacterium]
HELFLERKQKEDRSEIKDRMEQGDLKRCRDLIKNCRPHRIAQDHIEDLLDGLLVHDADGGNEHAGSGQQKEAEADDADQVAEYAGLPSENEDIRVVVLSVEETEKLLAEGKFNNALTIIAVQWFFMNKEKLRKKWGIS